MQHGAPQQFSAETQAKRPSRIAAVAIPALLITVLVLCSCAVGVYLASPEQRASLQLSSLAQRGADAPATADGSSWPSVAPRPIYPHITPAQGGSIGSTRHSFYFEGKLHTVEPQVDPAVYWGARNAPQEMTQYPDETDEEFVRAWEIAVICDPAQLAAVESLTSQLRAIRDAEGLDSDRYMELIAKYVQSMPYDNARAGDPGAANMFPVQLMVDRIGICEEKTRLIALLLMHEGYAVANLQFVPENHAAVGVRGSGATYGNSGWLFLESTGPAYVGEIPQDFLGGMTLRSEPWAIEIGDGSRTYDSASDVAYILDSREEAERAGQQLVKKMESQYWTDAEWQAMEQQLAIANQCYDYLWGEASQDGTVDSEFKDRVPALAWLEANAWW